MARRKFIAAACLILFAGLGVSFARDSPSGIWLKLPLWLQTRNGLAAICLRGPTLTPDGTGVQGPDEPDRRAPDACVAACAKGELGPGGCATVGEYQASFGRFGEPHSGQVVECGFAVALPHLAKACALGHAQHCYLAGSVASWVGFYRCAEVPEALPFFERGCSLGNRPSCQTIAGAKRPLPSLEDWDGPKPQPAAIVPLAGDAPLKDCANLEEA
jgi:hypothetical protein